MTVSGAAVAYTAAGGIILYSGIKGSTVSATVKSALSGTLNVSNTEPIATTAPSSGTGTAAAGNTGAANNSAAANQALAKSIATSMGLGSWTTGQEWADWVSLWNQESGWSTTAANPTSNARGIAQNINGWSADYPENDPTAQITWGINYIQQRYGSPVMAWAHEVANNWY
jgi:hypothetical protein